MITPQNFLHAFLHYAFCKIKLSVNQLNGWPIICIITPRYMTEGSPSSKSSSIETHLKVGDPLNLVMHYYK